jgi:hypothetical protein
LSLSAGASVICIYGFGSASSRGRYVDMWWPAGCLVEMDKARAYAPIHATVRCRFEICAAFTVQFVCCWYFVFRIFSRCRIQF